VTTVAEHADGSQAGAPCAAIGTTAAAAAIRTTAPMRVVKVVFMVLLPLGLTMLGQPVVPHAGSAVSPSGITAVSPPLTR
jgi:hypothetical protein